jgi:hypothetical protein
VLAHLVEIGDRDTQSALDDYLDVVADLLRELDASTGDLAARLRVAAAQSGHSEAPPTGSPTALGDHLRGPR